VEKMENTEKSTGQSNGPEKKFSTGAIQAAVWKNDGKSFKTGEPVEFNTVSLQRSYKDKQGNWKSTSSMRLNDLPRAALVLQKAYEYLVLKDSMVAGASSFSSFDINTKGVSEEAVM